MSQDQLTGTDTTFDAGPIADIPEDRFRILEIAGREVGLVRIGERVHAVRNICPHKTAPVCKGKITGTMLPSAPGEFVYSLEGEVLQCPWHGWQFSLETGEALFSGAPGRLRLYRTSIRAGRRTTSIYTDGQALGELRRRPVKMGSDSAV